jgi:hypothetical protein
VRPRQLGICPGLPVRRPRDPRLRDQYVQVACTVGNPRALWALRQPGHKSHCPRHWSKPGRYSRNKANTCSRYKGCLSSRGSVGGSGTVLEHPNRRAFAARCGQPSAASRPLDDPIVSRPGAQCRRTDSRRERNSNNKSPTRLGSSCWTQWVERSAAELVQASVNLRTRSRHRAQVGTGDAGGVTATFCSDCEPMTDFASRSGRSYICF